MAVDQTAEDQPQVVEPRHGPGSVTGAVFWSVTGWFGIAMCVEISQHGWYSHPKSAQFSKFGVEIYGFGDLPPQEILLSMTFFNTYGTQGYSMIFHEINHPAVQWEFQDLVRHCTVFQAIFCRDTPKFPYIWWVPPINRFLLHGHGKQSCSIQ